MKGRSLKCALENQLTCHAITEKGAARREARQRNADLVMQYVAGLLPEEYRGVYADSAIIPAETGQ